MHVQHVQPVVLHHLHHLGGERKIGGRLLEHRVLRRDHLVEEDVGREGAQPERQLLRDEVHLEAAPRQRHTEFGGHYA